MIFFICKAIAKRLPQSVYTQSQDFNMRICLSGFEIQRTIQPNVVLHKRKLCVSGAMVFFMPKSKPATKNRNR